MDFEQMTEEEIRNAAKERKIRNYHNKGLERLKKEILERDEETGKWSAPDNSLPKLSWSQVLDCLDSFAMRHLSDSVEALEVLGKPYAKDFVKWFSQYIELAGKGSIPVEMMYKGYKNRYGGMSIEYFRFLLEKVCDVYKGRGWVVEGDVFSFNGGSFSLEYHLQVWELTKKLHNTSMATRILTVLMGENDDQD